MDEKRLPTCSNGKVCFPKRAVQEKKNKLERLGRERLRYYQCNLCDWWHLSKVDRFEK